MFPIALVGAPTLVRLRQAVGRVAGLVPVAAVLEGTAYHGRAGALVRCSRSGEVIWMPMPRQASSGCGL